MHGEVFAIQKQVAKMNLTIRYCLNQLGELWRALTWSPFGYPAPSPKRAKRQVLVRYGGGSETWVETGTYFGATSRWLAARSTQVITIEPDAALARRATRQLSQLKNVCVVQGCSEDVFPELLPQLSGSIAFWLDGHFSGGVTGKGKFETPIQLELDEIQKNIARLSQTTVFVDDFRCFGSARDSRGGYPPRGFLVEWALANKMYWTVEHDIFVATTQELS